MFVPDVARFSRLLALPGNANLGAELTAAMDAIAEANPELAGVLPRGYAALPNTVLSDLLRLLAPLEIEGDAYGLVFEYFMGEFASAFMQKGGEYFTPASIVKLIVTATGQVDKRYPFGLPTVNNANTLWISLFYSALNETGRAGFVMANSASDAGGSERDIRRKLVETGAVDCIVSVGPNMFYTVTLPVTLWFLDRGKAKGPRADQVLFLDARHLFRQVTRAHRVFDPDQIEFLANIVRLWRGEPTEDVAGSGPRMAEVFPDGAYQDAPGLCRTATRPDIALQDWSLNPGRYVGLAPGQVVDDEQFRVKLEGLQEELEGLNAEAAVLQARIAENVAELLEV
jgi:type I restriction-modification system DNA methylase subunit